MKEIHSFRKKRKVKVYEARADKIEPGGILLRIFCMARVAVFLVSRGALNSYSKYNSIITMCEEIAYFRYSYTITVSFGFVIQNKKLETMTYILYLRVP